LPAVQKVREAASRLSCSNKLKQLGLALHRFHDVQGKFPPGQVQGPYRPAGVYWAVNHGWAVFILPYLEQQSLYNLYHWDRALSAPANQDVVAHPLENFWCPSAPEQDRYYYGSPFNTYTPPEKGACGDYAPTWYVDPALATGDNRGVLVPVGLTLPNSMTRMVDITDGTSNTILLAEDAGRPTLWQAGTAAASQPITGGPWAGFNTGITLRGSTGDGKSRPGPCALNCTNDHEIYSFHPGGTNALFADGGVRFLKAGTDLRVLAALITRAGGEVVLATDE
jgi:prepilin-type processing-associated H-X9-DG protein